MEDKKTDHELKILLDRKAEIEKTVQEQYIRKITVMFTDMKGFTPLVKTKGPIAGAAVVHKHNEILMDAINTNNPLFVKAEGGDETMSVYNESTDAIKAAIHVQKSLKKYNGNKPKEEQIQVKIGLDCGDCIVKERDAIGVAVNIAKRLESTAKADEILVSENLYRAVKSNDEFIFRYVDTVKLKGIEQPIKVYRVIWDEEWEPDKEKPLRKREGVFVLETSISENELKISGFEKADGEERPVKGYKEIRFNDIKIKEYTKGVIDLLNRANKRGKISNELLVKLKEYGRLLFDELIPVEIKEKLAKTNKKNLFINIDDRLVHIPWELLYDGKDFLCQRFSIGRSVSTKQPVSAGLRAIGRPLKMQILADPRGDLKASYEEGVSIKDEIGKLDDWMNIFLMTTDIKTDSVKAKIRNFDIVHFAGHAEHSVLTPEESGWFLKDGKLNAKDIKNMTGGMPMPSLVFSNACQTGQTDEWRIGEDYEHGIFGLANAFLLSGVQHYIGTFWEIPDEAGSHFAIHFYRNLIRGVTIGEAMQLSRRALIEKYGEDTIVWASYVLYGDPTTKYINLDIEKKDTVETLIHGTNGAGKPTSSSPERTPPYKWVLISSVSLLLIGLVMFTFINQKNKLTTFEDRKQEQVLSDQKAADESRKRIDELVASLSAKYREGKFEQPKAVQDEWSTKPLTMVFMDIKSSEGGSDDSERLIAQLSRFIQAETKINMVEREILTKLLEELSLSSSALADPATSLKLGKLLSARIIITGSIIPEKKAQTIILRFIDTETTAVTKVISAESLSGEIDKDTIGKIGNQILDWVKTDFPLRGRILSVTGDKCQINLGQIHGIKTGNRLEILKEQAKGSDLYAVTGEVEIGEVGKDKSVASILNRTDVIKEGTKVRGKLLKIM